MGAIFGSFVCCQVRRIRYKQEGKKLGKWSLCLKCGHKLSFWENIPVFSWIILRGKCHKCGVKIGLMEILAEVGLATIFGLVAWRSWPIIASGDVISIIMVILLYISLIIMWLLVLYDAKWGEMPTIILWGAVGVASIYAIMAGFREFSMEYLFELGISCLILPGLYLVLYKASRERLVGSGDWILALSIALLLGHWWLSLIELCLANILASIWGSLKLFQKKEHKIYFAPFLVIAFVVVWALKEQMFLLLGF